MYQQDDKIQRALKDYNNLQNELYDYRNLQKRNNKNQKRIVQHEIHNNNTRFSKSREKDIGNIMMLNRLEDTLVYFSNFRIK